MLSIASSSAAAFAATTARSPAPPPLPVAWSATSASAINEPALAPNGVVTTAGNTAIDRGVAHGGVIWKHTIPDQFGYPVSLLPPTVYDGTVDSVMSTGFAAGIADFDVTNGTPTLHGPTIHTIIEQLVTDRVTTTRLTGGFGTNFGPILELALGGYNWFVLFGTGNTAGLPALVGIRAFVPLNNQLLGDDPAQGCPVPPIPGPFCGATWTHTFGGAPNTPVGAATGDIVATDASGIVTALRAATGKVAWATPTFHTALGAPAYSNGFVYTGGTDGVLRAISATTGKVIWTGNAGAPITSAPAVGNGAVYVATDNGRLVRFTAAGCGTTTCAPTGIGNASLPGTHAAGAPVVRDHVAIVAYGTHLVAFTV